MKTLVVLALLSCSLFSVSARATESGPSREGYLLLQQAERLQEQGDKQGAEALRSSALDIFRKIALESEAVKQDSSQLPLTAPPPSNSPGELGNLIRQQEMILRQQQLILQKIARLEASNTLIQKYMENIRSDTRDLPELSSDIQDIHSDTSLLSDLESRMDEIEDNTQDIPELLNTVDEIDNNVGDLNGVEDAVNDIRDNRDLLDQIISIVEDIKGDTDRIGDVESAVDDVKDDVDNLDK